MWRGLLLLAIAAGTAACGSNGNGGILGGEVSCTLGVNGIPEAGLCQEVTGFTAAEVDAFEQSCVVGQGGDAGAPPQGATAVFAEAPCSRRDALGGCRIQVGAATQTVWYYAGGNITAADIEALCIGANTTYVAP
jgi:hypothetical protein